MSPAKQLNAADMLSRGRRGASRPASPQISEVGGQSSSELVDKSATPPVEQSSSGSVDQPIAGRVTYAKVAVSLTPELRRWVKTTPAALGVEGLSSSDLVRLALTRLRADVEDGLALTDLLIEQAHAEAQQLTGRRNRGLPSRD